MKKFFLYLIISIVMFCIGFACHELYGSHIALKSKLSFINNNLINTQYVLAQGGTTTDHSQLMARAINGEARGEPFIGQVAVGAVILNRVQNPSFPKTIPGVIYQPGAFTAVSDGQINVPLSSSSSAYKAARDSLNGWDPTGGAIYYYNPSKTTNGWIWSRPVVKVIGRHKFAK